jgi:glutaredoxin/glutathione-dependent peroxiredoxin
MIKVGDAIPAIKLKRLSETGMVEVDTAELFAGKASVLFAVPGCYTPTCSAKHLPSFLNNISALKAKGIDQVICLAVNDPFVMHQWLKDNKADAEIQALPDGNAAFTKALGLEMDGSGYGLGTRVQRFAMVIKDGKVTLLNVEKPGTFEVSGGDAVLQALA